jgi:CheY-like chemotaxis protein
MDILLVDDNADYLVPMKEALYEHGYNVYATSDGEQARRLLSSAQVDLIISDIKMPNVDGIQLHHHAREMAKHQKTSFVFISGYHELYSGKLQLHPDRDFVLDKTLPAQEMLRFIDRIMFGKYAEVWV